MKKEVSKKLKYKNTVTFTCSDSVLDSVTSLLRSIEWMGSAGASRSFIIEDCPKEIPKRYNIDGDGPDKLSDITVNGEPYED